MGWALPKPRAGSSRFTEKVKNYLTARFDLGEQTGRKADPQQVSSDMRKTTDEQNNGSLIEKNGWQKAKCKVFFPALHRVEEGSKIPQKSILIVETYCGRKKKLIDSTS